MIINNEEIKSVSPNHIIITYTGNLHIAKRVRKKILKKLKKKFEGNNTKIKYIFNTVWDYSYIIDITFEEATFHDVYKACLKLDNFFTKQEDKNYGLEFIYNVVYTKIGLNTITTELDINIDSYRHYLITPNEIANKALSKYVE